MRHDPDMTFEANARYGLVARSGWEQAEARAVLHDLGWEWDEHVHALAPPDDVDPADAGVQAVLELHRHGHRTGYLQGPYGTLHLRLAEAEQAFTRITTGQSTTPDGRTEPTDNATRRTVETLHSYANSYERHDVAYESPAQAAPPEL